MWPQVLLIQLLKLWVFVWIKGSTGRVRGVGFRPKNRASARLWMAYPRYLLKTGFSPEILQEAVEKRVELRVAFSQGFDLSNGVNHRRMMLPSKAAPDLRQRRMREVFA